MEVLYPRCAGLDVHKDSVVARIRCVSEPRHDEVRSFGTTTSALLELNDWLSGHGVTHVAMEATGVYWKAVWHVLEGDFELVLANAQHIRNVPGRKTKVGSVLSDVLGKSGRAILQALIAGESDPEKLADLAYGNARRKRAELVEALRGRIRPHHQALLRLHLNLIEALHQALADIDARVGKTLAPIQTSARLLTTMPGVSDLTAQVMVAEIGVEMARFPSAAHLISWAGLCPKNDESAGKRRSTRIRQGAPWLKTTLVTAAWGAVRVKDSYLQAQFHRLRARRGAKKAIVAVAASMLTAAYHMLKNGVEYQDLGAEHFTRRDRSKAIQRLVRRLNDLGCDVQLAAHAA